MAKEILHPILPFLTELEFDQVADLDQKLVGGEAWEFYSDGQIKRATVFENKLSGHVGNYLEEYEVEIIVEGDELRGSCNCSRSGGICKHVIALLYSWVNDQEGFLNVGDSLQELDSYDRERLLEIVVNIIRYDPKNFERFLYQEASFEEPDYNVGGYLE